MNPTIPEKILTDARDAYAAVVSERDELVKLQEANTARRLELELTADLTDAGSLDEIVRCQTIANLLPARRNHHEDRVTEGEKQLLAACHRFISSALSPRISELKREAETKTHNSLSAHFTDAAALVRAVSDSAIVRRFNELSWRATITSTPDDGVIEYANRLLATWNDLQKQP